MPRFATSVALLALAALSVAATPATRPATAVDAYVRAQTLFPTTCPAASAELLPDLPPYNDRWRQIMTAVARDNAAGLALAHAATTMPAGDVDRVLGDRRAVNAVRIVANQLADSARFAQDRGRSAVALDFVDDLHALATTINARPDGREGMLRLLVSIGIDCLHAATVDAISPRLHLGDGPDDASPDRVRHTIALLLDQTRAQALVDATYAARQAQDAAIFHSFGSTERCLEACNRANAERTMAAMSLACQLFRHDHGRWPNDADELVPAYLAAIPVDPWGDGHKTFGYRLIKTVPDNLDRPLVFCRCESKDGLAVTNETGLYWFYMDDGGRNRHPPFRGLGQFRDVAAWPETRIAANAGRILGTSENTAPVAKPAHPD